MELVEASGTIYDKLNVATLLKRRFGIEGPAFLHRIVAIDEIWLRDFEPELKSESNEWRCSGPPRPKKFGQA